MNINCATCLKFVKSDRADRLAGKYCLCRQCRVAPSPCRHPSWVYCCCWRWKRGHDVCESWRIVNSVIYRPLAWTRLCFDGEQLVGLELLKLYQQMSSDLGALYHGLIRLELLVEGNLKDLSLYRDPHVVSLHVHINERCVQMSVAK